MLGMPNLIAGFLLFSGFAGLIYQVAWVRLIGQSLGATSVSVAIVISSFDPIRREVARLSLQRLVADGRIHPQRIEEVVAKVRKQLEAQLGRPPRAEEMAQRMGCSIDDFQKIAGDATAVSLVMFCSNIRMHRI